MVCSEMVNLEECGCILANFNGVCLLEIGGERFSSLPIVRKHGSDNYNTLSSGYWEDCGNRLYQLVI